MDELLQRYGQSDKVVIKQFFDFLALRTRKSGKISDGVKKNQLVKWQKYPVPIVIRALNIYMQKDVTLTMNEKYVLGIMRNLVKEDNGIGGSKQGIDEGQRIAAKYADIGGTTECDF